MNCQHIQVICIYLKLILLDQEIIHTFNTMYRSLHPKAKSHHWMGWDLVEIMAWANVSWIQILSCYSET